MANLTHLVKSDSTDRTTSSTSLAEVTQYTISWSDLTTAGFANNDDVIILVRTQFGASANNYNTSFQVGKGSTFAGRTQYSDSLARVECADANARSMQYFWMDRITLSTNDNIYFALATTAGTSGSQGLRCQIYKLSDLSATDFAYAEATHSGDGPTTYGTTGAALSIPAAGDWLLWAHSQWLIDGTSNDLLMAINDDSSDIAEVSFEQEDNADQYCIGTLAYKASYGSGASPQVRFKVSSSSSAADCVSTKIFGLRLNAFEDHWGTYDETSDSVSEDVSESFAANASYSKTSTGPFIMIGMCVASTTATPTGFYGTITLDGSDFPSADGTWECVDNGAAQRVPKIFTGSSESVASGTRSLGYNVAASGGTFNRVVNCAVAYSLTLASTGTTITLPSALSIAIGKNAPTIAAGSHIDVPVKVAGALSASVPAIKAGAHVTVSAALAIALAAAAPTIKTGASASPSAASIALAANAPTLATGAGVSPTVASIAFGANAPTIEAGASVTAPVASAVAVRAYPPAVTGNPGVTYVGSGVRGNANNAAVTPPLPGGWLAGDWFFAFVLFSSPAGTIATPDGWTLEFTLGDANGDLYIYSRKAQVGDTAPTFTPSGGSAGDGIESGICAVHGAHATTPIGNVGANTINSVQQNIPVNAPSSTGLPTNGAVIFVGARNAGYTAASTLTGDSITWTEMMEFSNGDIGAFLGSDIGVWTTPAPTLTNKTFVLTSQTATSYGKSFVIVPAATGISVDCPTATSVALSANVPTIKAGASVHPPAALIALTVNTPTSKTGAGVVTPAATIALSVNTPTLATGAHVTLSTVSQLALAANAPAIKAGAKVSPTAASIALSGHAPTLATGAHVLPGAAAVTLSAHTPTITAGSSISVPASSVAVSVHSPTQYIAQDIFDASTPANNDNDYDPAFTYGTRFYSDISGDVLAIRFYKGLDNGGGDSHTVALYSDTGTLLVSKSTANEPASGWVTTFLDTPVSIPSNSTRTAAIFFPQGHGVNTSDAFNSQYDNGHLHVYADSNGGNGVYNLTTSLAYPTDHFNENYFIDVLFVAQAAISVPVATISVSANVPSIRAGAHTSAPTAAVALSSTAPAINTGSIAAVSTAAAITLTAHVPILTGGALVQPPTASISVAALAPSLGLGASIDVPTATIGLAAQAPNIAVHVQVPTLALSLSAYAPSFLEKLIVPATGVLPLEGNIPTMQVITQIFQPYTGELLLEGGKALCTLIRRPVIERTLLNKRVRGVIRAKMGRLASTRVR